LKLAIFSLSFFAVVLAIGTIVESKYSSKVAMELVYRTWWFKLLLAMLAINIFFAAVKKWPWKKHQTGFLITHAGLLTMIAGGMLNSFSGTDSLLVLVDSDHKSIQDQHQLPQVSDLMMDRDSGLIRVRLPGKDKVAEYDFNPGSLPWQRDRNSRGSTNTLLRILDFVAHPLPRSWGVTLDDGARLEVVKFWPHVRLEKYDEAEDGDPTEGLPAVKVRLTSAQAGSLPGRWLVPSEFSLAGQVSEIGPSMMEMLGKCPPELLDQFLNPPKKEKLGAKGLLVLHWKGRTFKPIDVAKAESSADGIPLGNTGFQVKNVEFTQKHRSEDPHQQQKDAEDPAVTFDLAGENGQKIPCRVRARLTGQMPCKGNNAEEELTDLHAWYHPPDYRYGNKGIRGLLQFVERTDNGKLYYRSFNLHTGFFSLEESGLIKGDNEAHEIWSGMNWQFQVTDHLRRAVRKDHYVHENLKPGVERPGYAPAVKVKLSVRGDSKEYWLQQTSSVLVPPDRLLTPARVGDREYDIGYSVQFRTLPFDLKLLRAEQTLDPGTHSPATYTSYVQLSDSEKKINGEDRVITMNEPLEHRGYKVYQSNYQALDWDINSRPVDQSGFTVGRDPGLPLKYAGTFMLAGGIVCMFYMRAYFFKRPGRKTAPLLSNVQAS
jgi:hypothetical protein